jgi:hypothetical protein
MRLFIIILLCFLPFIPETHSSSSCDEPFESKKGKGFSLHPRDVEESFYEGVNMSPRSFFGRDFCDEWEKAPVIQKNKQTVKVYITLPQMNELEKEDLHRTDQKNRSGSRHVKQSKEHTEEVEWYEKKKVKKKKVFKKKCSLPPLIVPPHLVKKEKNGVSSPDKEEAFFSFPSLSVTIESQVQGYEDTPKHRPLKKVLSSYLKSLSKL